jgi:hypothetical protein
MLNNNIFIFLVLITGLTSIVSCSSNTIKPLSEIELAQQLIIEQEQQPEKTIHPVKIHYIQPEKAIVGNQLDIDIELVSSQPLTEITLAYKRNNGLELTRNWLLRKRDSVTTNIKKIEADKIYRQKISIIPQQEGLLQLNLYILYQLDEKKKARQQTLSFSIGHPLGKAEVINPAN